MGSLRMPWRQNDRLGSQQEVGNDEGFAFGAHGEAAWRLSPPIAVARAAT